MESKILKFPESKIVRDPVVDMVISHSREKTWSKVAEGITQDLIGELYDHVEDFENFDLKSDEFQKDFSITTDMIRAMVYRSLGVPHHLHEFIDSNVEIRTAEDGIDAEAIKTIMKEMYQTEDAGPSVA